MVVSSMAERNKELILEVLADYVDNTSQAFGLELASGTGQHVVHFAQALPNVTWQPSEVSPSAHLMSGPSMSPGQRPGGCMPAGGGHSTGKGTGKRQKWLVKYISK
uniref:Methyltransferase like 26 n=1 Tax=Gopherus agassizii TaxID=38772 RepID=A0A452HRQ9_9SAUR